MQLNDQELKELLEDVKVRFAQTIKSEEEKLAKSEESDEEAKMEKANDDHFKDKSKIPSEKKEVKKEEKEDEEEEEEEEEKEMKKKKMKKEEDEKKDKEKEKEEEEKEAKKSEGEDYGFDKLTKGEREACYKSLKKMVWKDRQEEAPAEETKSQDLAKAEEEIKELKKEAKERNAEVEDLKKGISEITKALEIFAKGPDRKALTGTDFVGKPGEGDAERKPRSREEIKTELYKIKPEKMNKSERDAVNEFFMTGANEEEVIKLLEKNQEELNNVRTTTIVS